MNNETNKIKEGLFILPSSPSEEGYLIASKCSSCGIVSFPKRIVCPVCLTDDTMREVPLSRKGQLYSFAINLVAPAGFEAPYIIGKIDLPEKVRIFSVITECDPKDDLLHIGMEMELVFDRIREDEDGNDLIGYKFRPVVKK